MKQFMSLMCCALLMVGCSDESESTTPTPPTTQSEAVFVGKLEVSPNTENRFEAFSAEEIEFILHPGAEAGTLTLSMPEIKFVSQMPVWISLDLPNLPTTVDNQLLTFEMERMLPYFMGEPYDPKGDGTYEVSNLIGTCNLEENTLWVEFDCYTMHVDYQGVWQSDSANMEQIINAIK